MQRWDGLPRIWFDLGATPQYYPLVFTTFWLEHKLWGLSALGYHIVNVILHGINAGLLWRLLRRLAVPGAWLAAAIFALHPVHVESVAWVTERKNVLSGLFYLLGGLTFLRTWRIGTTDIAARNAGDTPTATLEAHRPPPEAGMAYASTLLLLLAALLSKTATCMFPVAAVLILWWKRGRVTHRDATYLAPMFGMALAAGLFTVYFEKHYVGAKGLPWSMTPLEHVLLAGRIFWFYPAKLLWPDEFAFIYPRWTINATNVAMYAYPLAAAAVLTGAWWLRGRVGRGPFVALAYYAATLMPVMGFFDVYFMQFSFVADHFVYLPSVGIVALVVATAWHLGRRLAAGRFYSSATDDRGRDRSGLKPTAGYGVLGRVIAAAVLLTLGVRTFAQATGYINAEVLWRDTLAKNPTAWIAHNNLGLILQQRGEIDEAAQHYRQALRIQPRSPQAHSNLGTVLAEQGDLETGLAHFRRALEIDPSDVEARHNLATALLRAQRWEAATEEYRRVIGRRPRHVNARFGLAVALRELGRYEESRRELEVVLHIEPDHERALRLLHEGWPADSKE